MNVKEEKFGCRCALNLVNRFHKEPARDRQSFISLHHSRLLRLTEHDVTRSMCPSGSKLKRPDRKGSQSCPAIESCRWNCFSITKRADRRHSFTGYYYCEYIAEEQPGKTHKLSVSPKLKYRESENERSSFSATRRRTSSTERRECSTIWKIFSRSLSSKTFLKKLPQFVGSRGGV